MYSTFSHSFSSPTHGDKKFYLTLAGTAAEPAFEGKINDDKTVKKFQMKKAEGGWKIQPQVLPAWVTALEKDFSDRIEAVAAR